MFSIVSCYYNIPSKQPSWKYYEYMPLFFKHIQDIPILFFTDSENYEKLKNIAGSNVTFILQEFEQLSIFKQLPIEFWKQQIQYDPEKYHTWQVGALWANKGFFVRDAICHTSKYDWYMWVDAGCVRTEDWKPTLDQFGKRGIGLTENIYVQILNPLPSRRYFWHPDIFVAGSHILFHKSLVDKYLQKYIETVIDYTENKVPVISDQYIISTMITDTKFIVPIHYKPSFQAVNEWFFFFCLF